MRGRLLILSLALPVFFCYAQEAVLYNEPADEQLSSECEQAHGVLVTIEECDGSQSLWCMISEKEQCYADQVKDGHCTVGEYSEELHGIVGVTPRVLCDYEQ